MTVNAPTDEAVELAEAVGSVDEIVVEEEVEEVAVDSAVAAAETAASTTAVLRTDNRESVYVSHDGT